MNDSSGRAVNAAGTKQRSSSTSLALIVGLALLLPGTAALAIGTPIPGIDIVVKKNPGGTRVSVPTGADGAYQFTGLSAGSYVLSVGGQRVQTISVGANRSIGGVLSSDGGKASITFNGQVGVVPDRGGVDGSPSAAISTSRSNIKRLSIAKAEEPSRDVLPSEANSAMGVVSKTQGTAPHSGGGDEKPGITGGPYLTITLKEVLVSSKIAENESPRPTNRGISVAVGDVNGDGVPETRTATPPKSGDKELQSKAGDPLPGKDIGLEGDPGSVKVSAKTDSTGAFHFDKLPAGNYTLKLSGLPDQTLTIGTDGIAGGKVMRGPDGKMSIFDRWGNSFTNDVNVRKAAETPIEFGSGNTMGSGPNMGPGMSPGAGPDMGGPMGPSAGRP